MGKKHNTSDYMGGKERGAEAERSFPEELVEISKSVYTHIFGPISDERVGLEVGTIDFEVAKDMVEKFGNAYNGIMHPYEKGEIDSKFDEFFIDFKNQLELLCKKVNDYINNEQCRDSEIFHIIIDGMFKLNKEFYNLSIALGRDELKERLTEAMMWSSINNDEMSHIHTFSYIETEREKERREEYKQKIDQVKRLWIGIYHFLMQLIDKELGALLANEDEESFRNGLKTSYIGEQIKGVEYGENFSRSHSILKHKHEEILKQLSELKKCFDEKGNLKDEAKIPALDDISILKISKGDRRKYNKGKMKERFTRLISGMQKTEGSNKEK